jgi:hypothetical protein
MASSNVMLRLTHEEHARLREAWASSASDPWRRLAFATWCRRTLLNLYPAPGSLAAAKKAAKDRTLDLFEPKPKPKSFRERYGPSRGTPKRRKVA